MLGHSKLQQDLAGNARLDGHSAQYNSRSGRA